MAEPSRLRRAATTAMDMDHAVGEIDVDPREVQRFIEPQAGADEDGDEGP